MERVITSNCFEWSVMLKVAFRLWSTEVRLTLATLKRNGADVTVALLATVSPPAGTLTTGLLMHSMVGSLVPRVAVRSSSERPLLFTNVTGMSIVSFVSASPSSSPLVGAVPTRTIEYVLRSMRPAVALTVVLAVRKPCCVASSEFWQREPVPSLRSS
jgi:hypothetical protein